MAVDRPRKSASSTVAISSAGIPISPPDLVTPTPTAPTSRWVQQDLAETREILLVFWNECILKNKQNIIEDVKDYLKNEQFRKSPAGVEIIDKIFKDAPLDFENFCAAIQQFPLRFIYKINEAEKLISPKKTKELARRLDEEDINDLIGHMREEKISASVSLRANSGPLITPDIPENKSSYAMHSIGKVFTGILVLRMVQEGVIKEDDLKKPLAEVESFKSFIDQLPELFQTHLREKRITLYEMMTHHAGLGDYLWGYHTAIRNAVEAGKPPPEIKEPKDLLVYAQPALFPVREEKYSNLGSLFVGLAIKSAYEKKHNMPYDYDKLLRHYVIDEAKMSCFSTHMPEGGKFGDPRDIIAPNVVGCPAGGYWTTAADLAKFGKWIYEKCMADEKSTSDRPKLKKLIEDYGQEFYKPDPPRVEHGGTERTSCAEFSVSLATGAVVAILSDQPPPVALYLREKIQEKFFSFPVTLAPDAPAPVAPTAPDSLSHRP